MEFKFKNDETKEEFKKQFGGKNIRFFLSRKSWTGVSFDWVQDEPNEEDTVVEVEGANIVLDPKVVANTPYMNINYGSHGPFDPDFIINYSKY